MSDEKKIEVPEYKKPGRNIVYLSGISDKAIEILDKETERLGYPTKSKFIEALLIRLGEQK